MLAASVLVRDNIDIGLAPPSVLALPGSASPPRLCTSMIQVNHVVITYGTINTSALKWRNYHGEWRLRTGNTIRGRLLLNSLILSVQVAPVFGAVTFFRLFFLLALPHTDDVSALQFHTHIRLSAQGDSGF